MRNLRKCASHITGMTIRSMRSVLKFFSHEIGLVMALRRLNCLIFDGHKITENSKP